MCKNVLLLWMCFVLSGWLNNAIAAEEKGKEIGNLVKNSSFEANPVGYQGEPTGWSGITNPKYLSVVADSPEKEFGEKSLLIDYARFREETGKSKPGKWMINQRVPIENSKKYLQSCWIKSDGVTETGKGVLVGRAYYDKNKKEICGSTRNGQNYSYMVFNQGPKKWTYFKQILVPDPTPGDGKWKSNEIPKGACYLSIWAGGYNYPYRVWFDGLRLEPYRQTSGTLAIGDKKVCRAREVRKPPLIDGKLTEAVWKEERDWAGNFRRTICPLREAKSAADQTRFKVLYDKDFVYIGIICDESEPSKIKAPKKTRNDVSLWADDSIEIHFDPTYQKKYYFYLVVNAGGSIGEQLFGNPTTSNTKVVTTLTKKGWQAEIRISKKGLREELFARCNDALNNNIWYMNITRHQPGDGNDRFTSWGYTRERSFHNVKTLGSLFFANPKEVLVENLSLRNTEMQGILTSRKNLMKVAPDTPSRIKEVQTQITNLFFSHNSFLSKIEKESEIGFSEFSRVNRESLRTVSLFETKLNSLERLCVKIPKDRRMYGYVIYTTPLFESPDPDRLPRREEIAVKVSLKLARDEYEPATFSIFTNENLKDIKITWTSLEGRGNQIIPKEAIDVRILKPWKKKGQADILATDLRVELKGWLTNYASLPRFIPEISPNTSCHFWVKVYASSTQPAGIYKGKITVTPANKPSTTIPLEVEVLPFGLENPGKDIGFFYTAVIGYEGQPARGTGGACFYGGLATRESMLAELKTLRNSGFNSMVLFAYAKGPLNPEYCREILSVAKEAGFKKIVLQGAEHIIMRTVVEEGGEGLERAKATLSKRVGEIVKIGKELGFKELYFFGADEPRNQNAIERNKIICQIAHKWGSQVVVAIICDNHRKSLEDVIDVPIMNWAELAQGNSEIFHLVTEGKRVPHKKVYYYANLRSPSTLAVRLAFGLYLYKSSYDGNLPWAYYDVRTHWEPFRNRKIWYVFPTKDEPIPTLLFEAAREGVDDLRYIRTLEKQIRTSKNKVVVSKAKENLRGILDQISLVNEQGTSSANYRISPEKYQEFRRILQDTIRSLLQ